MTPARWCCHEPTQATWLLHLQSGSPGLLRFAHLHCDSLSDLHIASSFWDGATICILVPSIRPTMFGIRLPLLISAD